MLIREPQRIERKGDYRYSDSVFKTKHESAFTSSIPKVEDPREVLGLFPYLDEVYGQKDWKDLLNKVVGEDISVGTAESFILESLSKDISRTVYDIKSSYPLVLDENGELSIESQSNYIFKSVMSKKQLITEQIILINDRLKRHQEYLNITNTSTVNGRSSSDTKVIVGNKGTFDSEAKSNTDYGSNTDTNYSSKQDTKSDNKTNGNNSSNINNNSSGSSKGKNSSNTTDSSVDRTGTINSDMPEADVGQIFYDNNGVNTAGFGTDFISSSTENASKGEVKSNTSGTNDVDTSSDSHTDTSGKFDTTSNTTGNTNVIGDSKTKVKGDSETISTVKNGSTSDTDTDSKNEGTSDIESEARNKTLMEMSRELLRLTQYQEVYTVIMNCIRETENKFIGYNTPQSYVYRNLHTFPRMED